MNYGFGGMMQGFGGSYGPGFGSGIGAGFLALAPFMILFVVWSIFWKGLALWHSAKRGQGWWFIILLAVNTLGILEIIYLFAVLKLKLHDLFPKKSPPSSPDVQM